MIVLAIETSCDETACAVVQRDDSGVKILSNVVASSQEIHKKYGGIIPEMAAREQVRCIIPVIEESFRTSGLEQQDLDAIAVTRGPGLIGSLLIGVETAKALAFVWNKPLIPVNHLTGHIYANWLNETSKIIFPAVVLIVSGGHTELVLMKAHGKFEWIGGTRDDAAGECFDKCARLLELGYPGGPAIAASAAKFKILNLKFEIKLPRPLIDSNDFDFSFSGLKTAVLRDVRQQVTGLRLRDRSDSRSNRLQGMMAYEIQEAVTDVLVKKTLRAAEKYKVKSILLSGGVAANQRLREKMRQPHFAKASQGKQVLGDRQQLKLYVPEPRFCTDNAAMIGAAACFNYSPSSWQKIEADPGLVLTGAV